VLTVVRAHAGAMISTADVERAAARIEGRVRRTPVLAAESGTVLRISRNSLGGNTIYMTDDGGRFIYYYAHLLRYADGLAAGAHVSQGDVIAYVGMTGNAPVPHLHFQVMRREARRDYWNGTAVDVRPFFTLIGRARSNDAEQGAGESTR